MPLDPDVVSDSDDEVNDEWHTRGEITAIIIDSLRARASEMEPCSASASVGASVGVGVSERAHQSARVDALDDARAHANGLNACATVSTRSFGEESDEETQRDETRELEEFEISDGDVSLHSESSHDRTRGIKSFKVSDVVGEEYGKGKRGLVRRTIDGKTVGEVLSDGRRTLESDSDESASASDDDDAMPTTEDSPIIVDDETPTKGERAKKRKGYGCGRREERAESRSATLGERTKTFGEINKTFKRVAQGQITVFAKACAPWKFNHRVFVGNPPSSSAWDSAAPSALEDSRVMDQGAKREGSRVLAMVMADFIERNSSGRVAAKPASQELSRDAVSEWRHAMALLERGGGFWKAVKARLVDIVDDERILAREIAKKSDQEMEDGDYARPLEFAWELVFIAAKLWFTEGYQTEHAANTDWASAAWDVVIWLVSESRVAQYPIEPSMDKLTHRIYATSAPTRFNADEYTRAVCDRVAELVVWWPRCAVDGHPVRELWKRMHGADFSVEKIRDVRAPARNPSPCCRPCMPISWCPFDRAFDAAKATFVGGGACEVLNRALGIHLSKCEPKALRRELGKWLGDSRLSKVRDSSEVNIGTDGFVALGGHQMSLPTAIVNVQHRASVHVELFRVCLASTLDDQAALCLKQIIASIPSQMTSSENPAARCVLLRALTTCLGIWLANGHSSGYWGRKPGDEALRVMSTAVDISKVTGCTSISMIGSAHALNDGAIVAEASAAWVAAFNVLVAAEPERKQEALDVLQAFEERAFSSDWRERLFIARTLAALCSTGSFAEKYGLDDLRPALTSWLVLAVDAVSGGTAPLAAALCGRNELLIVSQEATSVSTVGWCQSKAGAAVAAALRGRIKHTPPSGGEEHVGVISGCPGSLITPKESAFRVAVARLAAKEFARTIDADNSAKMKLDLGILARITRDLPAHSTRLFQQLRAASKDQEGSAAIQAAHANAVSGIVKEMILQCAPMLVRADIEMNGVNGALALPFLMPFPPAFASSWGTSKAGERSRLGDIIAPVFENDAGELFRAQLRAVESLRYTHDKERENALSRRELSSVTFGVLEAITGAPMWLARENALINAISRAICLQPTESIVLKQFLPHFVLSSLKAPQKCGARRISTAIKMLSTILSLEDASSSVTSVTVLNAMALPLITVVHEALKGDSYDHHASMAVAAVLTDVLVPLLKAAHDDRGVGTTSSSISDSSHHSSAISSEAPTPPAPASVVSRPYFPFPGARSTVASAPPRPPQSRPISVTRTTPTVATATAMMMPISSKPEALRALNTSAVWRIVCAHISASVAFLTRVALAAPVNAEITTMSAFQVMGRRPPSVGHSPRSAEITRLREILLDAKQTANKALSVERKEAERLLGDALEPLPESFQTLDTFSWGMASEYGTRALAPNAFVVEEDASERGRRIVYAAVSFLTHVAKLQGNGFAEVSKRAVEIQAAVTILLEPGCAASKTLDITRKALLQTLGLRVIDLPSRVSARRV